MSGNRFRRLALATAAASALALAGIGVLVAIESIAYLAGRGSVTFDWSRPAEWLGDARLGEAWVTAIAAGLCVIGALFLVLSTARSTRRRVRVTRAPAAMAVTLDAADARTAAVVAATSVPAVDRAAASWTIRKRMRVKVRCHRSSPPAGPEVDELITERVAEALDRLGVQPARGVKVTRARRPS